MEKETVLEKINQMKNSIHQSYIGNDAVIEKLLICLLSEGHVLLEDVPGIGKTTLAKLFAESLGLSLGRIQFTPDTMPSDVTGVSVYQMKTGEFVWKPGPVMNHIVLADEINRTPPKTQAGLLEVMAEGQVSVDGASQELPKPFLVIATQNPVEYVGTYPLPEASLDRFMMRLSLGYPDSDSEVEIAKTNLAAKKTESKVEPVFTAKELLEVMKLTEAIELSDKVLSYAAALVKATREDERIRLGASTRAMLALVRAARTKAFLDGKDFVEPDDIKALASDVLSHRLVLSVEAKRQQLSSKTVLMELMKKVRIPV